METNTRGPTEMRGGEGDSEMTRGKGKSNMQSPQNI